MTNPTQRDEENNKNYGIDTSSIAVATAKESFDDETVKATSQGKGETQQHKSSITSNKTDPKKQQDQPNKNESNDKAKPSRSNYSQKQEYIFMLCAGLALTFNAGFINGCCVSSLLVSNEAIERGEVSSQSVAGFTGAFTKSGLSLAGADFGVFTFQSCMILCFVFGSFVAGVLNPRSIPFTIGPAYGPTFLLGSMFLATASFLAASSSVNTRYIFFFAAIANGLQNGMSSMYSANLIRSCHFTGASTDMGLFAGQVIRGNRKNLWKLRVLMGLTISFWSGSSISFFAVRQLRSFTLLINAGLFFLIGCSLIAFLVQKLQISIWQATSGNWEWGETLRMLEIFDEDGNMASEEKLLETFDRIDADGSGTIDVDELKATLTEQGIRLNQRKMKRMLQMVDEDGDGCISRSEWLQFIIATAGDQEIMTQASSQDIQGDDFVDEDDDSPDAIRRRGIRDSLQSDSGVISDSPDEIRKRELRNSASSARSS